MAGFYLFRLDDQPTRCLPLSVTLEAAGFSEDAAGVFAIAIHDNRVPGDLASGTIAVPATASLSITGTGESQPELDVTFEVHGSLALEGCAGTIVSLAVTGSQSTRAAFSIDAASTTALGPIELQDAGTVELTDKDFIGGPVSVTSVHHPTTLAISSSAGSVASVAVFSSILSIDAETTISIGDLDISADGA